jgi:hypothetical protein
MMMFSLSFFGVDWFCFGDFWVFLLRFELVLGGLCSAKDPQTPKGGLRRGEKKEVVAALLLFPPP